jgi:hypothetical protein
LNLRCLFRAGWEHLGARANWSIQAVAIFRRRMRLSTIPLGVLACGVCLVSSAGHAIELTNLELVFEKSRRCIGLPADTINFWGRSISVAGDVNGDGYDDIVIAAASYDTLTALRPWLAKAFIFLGGRPMDTLPDVILSGAHDGEARVEVSYAGDLNYDGFSDVMMSNHGDPGVLVFFGGSPMDTSYDLVLMNNLTYSYANCVAYAGDVNGDGFDDVAVGDYMYDNLNGSVAVFFGGPSLDGCPDVMLRGSRREGFGMQVAGGGDVNSDGYDDIVVGEWDNSEMLLYAGKIYIFLGGDPMDTIPDAWMYGEGSGQRLGWTELDVLKNDTGCDWVVAGNLFYPDGFPVTCPGKIYVLFGDTLMDGLPDVTMIGRTDSSGLGQSTRSAGRVVGEGLDGIVSGAASEYEWKGSTYLWLSDEPFDTVPDGIAAGSYSPETPAWRVSSGGDTDRDGRDEVMFSNTPTPDSIKTVWVCRYAGTGIEEQGWTSGSSCSALLMQNQPNPFWGSTVIRFRLSSEGLQEASLDILDAAGRRVIRLWDGSSRNPQSAASMLTVIWDGRNEEGKKAPAGVYFCRLRGKGFDQTRKMVFLR